MSIAHPDPTCTVNGSATTNGVNVAASSTPTIALIDTGGVKTWSLTCINTDDLLVATTVTAGLSIDSIAKTATLAAPTAGSALIFQSQVNGGKDGNGNVDASLTTTFAIFVLTAGGNRVAAFDETLEGSAAFGWVAKFNSMARAVPAVGGTALLTGITAPAGSPWAFVHTPNATGAGLTDTWSGQAAASGAFSGGKTRWSGGTRGDGDHWQGDIEIGLGPEDNNDTRSAYMSWWNTADFSGSAFLTLNSEGGEAVWVTPGGSRVSSGAGTEFVVSITSGSRFSVDTNIAMHAAGSFGGGTKVLFLGNASVVPSTSPTGGAILYVDSGAIKGKGSGGTVTTMAPAEPHCPSCGRDFAHEWENSRTGEHLAICMPCMLGELGRVGCKVDAFAFVNKLI